MRSGTAGITGVKRGIRRRPATLSVDRQRHPPEEPIVGRASVVLAVGQIQIL